jgi:hypothetical protein
MASRHPDKGESSRRVRWVLRLGLIAVAFGSFGIFALQAWAATQHPLILVLAGAVFFLMTVSFILEYAAAMSPQLRQLRELL